MFTSFQRSVDVSFSLLLLNSFFFHLAVKHYYRRVSFRSNFSFISSFFFFSFFNFIHSVSHVIQCSHTNKPTYTHIRTIRKDMNKRILKTKKNFTIMCRKKKAKRTTILHTYVSSVFGAVEGATTFALHLFHSEHAMNDPATLLA